MDHFLLARALASKVTNLALQKVGLLFVRWDSPFSPLETKLSTQQPKFSCMVLTTIYSRVDAMKRFDTLEKEALRSKRGAESVAT